MKGARSLLFEIVGCGLLLAAAYGIFSSTPEPEWKRSDWARDVLPKRRT